LIRLANISTDALLKVKRLGVLQGELGKNWDKK
jgi:hypothetical protein